MREIKFRAWDGKKMLYADGKDGYPDNESNRYVLFDGEGWSLHYGLNFDQSNKQIITDFRLGGILMQFTGLKDKAGREIYEGDILKTVGLMGSEAPFDAVVEFLDNGYWIKMPSGQLGMATNREVIGNIYENAELLDKGKEGITMKKQPKKQLIKIRNGFGEVVGEEPVPTKYKGEAATRRVKAWMVLTSEGEVLNDPVVAFHLGEVSSFSRKFYQIVPCTVTYSCPRKKKI